MAALRARRERPSELREETIEVKKNRKETSLGTANLLEVCFSNLWRKMAIRGLSNLAVVRVM